MLNGKVVWLIMVQFSFKGCYCSNSTQNPNEAFATLGASFSSEKTSHFEETTPFASKTTLIPADSVQSSALDEKISVNSSNVSQTDLEILKIFHGEMNISTEQLRSNKTAAMHALNVSSENSSYSGQLWNDTFRTNYTTMAEAVESFENALPFRLPNSAAIAAGVCLVSAVVGYISCVSYRRFLQRKYGNSQILIGEDVYDTTDLRNFEI